MRKLALFGRLMQFRHELVLLFRAFFDTRTPLHLKAAMVALVAYVISPFDLVPEFLPFLGIVDDLVLIPFAVDWIAKRLPPGAGAKTVEGTARRR